MIDNAQRVSVQQEKYDGGNGAKKHPKHQHELQFATARVAKYKAEWLSRFHDSLSAGATAQTLLAKVHQNTYAIDVKGELSRLRAQPL